MAKITTITNPLTGQPAQVDQLEHTAQEIDDAIARALPSGAIDMALQNKLGGIESTEYPGCYYRMVSGVVEWFNPPMQLGVECRTTERFNGKPVYVKLIDVGPMPNTDQLLVSANIGGNTETTVIGFDGYMDNGESIDKFPVFWLPGELKAYMFVMVHNNKWKVGVRSLIDLTAYTAKCLIKYIKIEG